MRVLHVLDISIPMIAGYTSRSRYIVNNQKALGLDPVVVTSPRHENKVGASMEVLDDVRYHRTPALGDPSHAPPLPAPLAALYGQLLDGLRGKAYAAELLEIDHLRRRIVDVARREEVDLIHAHSSILCGIPGFLAARQLGLPSVYEIRAFWEDAAVDAGTNAQGSAKYRAIQALETELAKRSDALIGICQGIKAELVGRGIDEGDVFVVPNGVETDRFQPSAPDPETLARYGLQGKTVVAYIGTFAAFEGVRFLVEALVKLIQGGRDDLRGLIVGTGPTYDACRAITERAGLTDKILHPGHVPHAEVKKLYSVVDILAYPRDRQRITELVTPLKPLEAMAMEKAVIGSDVGGLTELITDGETGLIHRAEDVDDLAAKIVRLADDPELRARLGRQGRVYVTRERNWRSIIEGHLAVYARARANWSKRAYLHRGIARVGRRWPL
jgi:PEP-CTERM/exosortase A-associated glycosyltransferase